MTRRLRLLLIAILVALGLLASIGSTAQAQRRRSSRSYSTRSYSPPRQRTEHVRSYQRRNGTTVRSYYRAPAGYGTRRGTYKAPRASAYRAPRVRTYGPRVYAPKASQRSYVTAGGPTRDSRGRIRRSATAKRDFMRMSGYPHGRPGYVIDHIVPLACGGADAPSNMQWQTRAEAAAKDKTERIGCGSHGGRH